MEEEELVKRLESAVARLEAFSVSGFGNGSQSGWWTGFGSGNKGDMKSECVVRVLAAAGTIGGEVLEVSMIVDEAFRVQKELLCQIKKSQVVWFFFFFVRFGFSFFFFFVFKNFLCLIVMWFVPHIIFNCIFFWCGILYWDVEIDKLMFALKIM